MNGGGGEAARDESGGEAVGCGGVAGKRGEEVAVELQGAGGEGDDAGAGQALGLEAGAGPEQDDAAVVGPECEEVEGAVGGDCGRVELPICLKALPRAAAEAAGNEVVELEVAVAADKGTKGVGGGLTEDDPAGAGYLVGFAVVVGRGDKGDAAAAGAAVIEDQVVEGLAFHGFIVAWGGGRGQRLSVEGRVFGQMISVAQCKGRAPSVPNQTCGRIRMGSADISCPMCGSIDKVEKVSSIVGQGVVTVSGDRAEMEGYVRYTEMRVSSLAEKLRLPERPREPGSGCGCNIVMGLLALMFFGGAIVALLRLLAPDPISELFTTFISTREDAQEPLITDTILGVVLLLVWWQIQRGHAGAKSQYEVGLPRWERAQARWEHLYYCYRDDIVFDVSASQQFLPEMTRSYLFSD